MGTLLVEPILVSVGAIVKILVTSRVLSRAVILSHLKVEEKR